MADINDILAASKPRRHTARICVRGELVDEQRALEAELKEVRSEDERKNRKPQAPTIAKKIEALQKEAEEATYEFSFEAIGQRKWNDLMAKNPPTPDQKKIAKQTGDRVDFDVIEFPIKAIAASCVSPELSEENARRLYERWNFSQWNTLWMACLEANLGDSSLPKSALASLILGHSSQKSERASDSESLGASS